MEQEIAIKIKGGICRVSKIELKLLFMIEINFVYASKIENFFGILKENKRLSMRFEKSNLCFLEFIALDAIKYHLCELC